MLYFSKMFEESVKVACESYLILSVNEDNNHFQKNYIET